MGVTMSARCMGRLWLCSICVLLWTLVACRTHRSSQTTRPDAGQPTDAAEPSPAMIQDARSMLNGSAENALLAPDV